MASCSQIDKRSPTRVGMAWRTRKMANAPLPRGNPSNAAMRHVVIGGNDESGCDRSMESQSAGSGRRELAALVARLLSMLSKKNSTASSFSPPPSSRSRAAAAMESGGSWTSSTAGSAVFLASIRQRFCRTRFRRRNSFFATACVANAPDNNRKQIQRQSNVKKKNVGGGKPCRPPRVLKIKIRTIKKIHSDFDRRGNYES